MSKFAASRHSVVFWTALSILLTLRIPLESWLGYLVPATAAWVEPLYEIGTYSLIAFLIWWERDQLALYHLDPLATIIIIFFKPLSTILLPGWEHTAAPAPVASGRAWPWS